METDKSPAKRIKELLKINSLKDILQNYAVSNSLNKKYLKFSLFSRSKEIILTLNNDPNLYLALTKGQIDVASGRNGFRYSASVSYQNKGLGFKFGFNISRTFQITGKKKKEGQ